MATSSKAAKPGTAPASTVSGAQRRENASSRLADTQQQLAQIAQDIADLHAQIDAAAKMELSAQKGVKAAEVAADLAAAHVVDTQAAMMVADGTSGEAGAEQDYNQAIASNQEARVALDQSRQVLADLHAKNQTEVAATVARISELEDKQRNAHRLAQSLEHLVTSAHHAAGVESLLASQDRHQQLHDRKAQLLSQLAETQSDIDEHRASVAALVQEHPELEETREYFLMVDKEAAIRAILDKYLQYWAEMEKGRATPQALGHMHSGFNLPFVLLPDDMTRPALHAILMDGADTPVHQSTRGIIEKMRAGVVELLGEMDGERERKLAGLPPATA